ncbi:MAG: hypothetical protein ABWZ66_09570 [Pyrinomonadaceae bacterium]
MKRLKSEKSADKAVEFERLPATATVGKDYVAYRFLCSEEAVLRGRAGTHRLRTKRVSDKPLKWIKSDVDAAWREHTKSVPEKAAEERAKARQVKKRSIVSRTA